MAARFTRRTGLMEHLLVFPATAVSLIGSVESPAPYARVHEFGGTIRPRNAAHLAIPLDAMKTRRGVARGRARDVIASPRGWGYDSTFTAKNVIFGKNKGGSYDPLFALKSSVRMPERPTARPALEEVRPVYEATVVSALTRLFSEGR